MGRVCRKSPKRKVLPPKGMLYKSSEISEASINGLQHWQRHHGCFIQNEQVISFHILSNLAVWHNTTATTITAWYWQFEGRMDGPAKFQEGGCNSSPCCSFDLVATCNFPVSNLIEEECFSSSSWGINKVHSSTSWDEIVFCN